MRCTSCNSNHGDCLPRAKSTNKRIKPTGKKEGKSREYARDYARKYADSHYGNYTHTCPGKNPSRAGKITLSSCMACTSCALAMEDQAAAISRRVEAPSGPGLAAATSLSSFRTASRNA